MLRTAQSATGRPEALNLWPPVLDVVALTMSKSMCVLCGIKIGSWFVSPKSPAAIGLSASLRVSIPADHCFAAIPQLLAQRTTYIRVSPNRNTARGPRHHWATRAARAVNLVPTEFRGREAQSSQIKDSGEKVRPQSPAQQLGP